MRYAVGIFVGGRGRRMGGAAKGLLALPDGRRVLERLILEARAGLPDSEIVLVGAAEAYTDFGLRALADEPPGIGPLGGLAALLLHAESTQRDACVALACDLPFVSRALILRLANELRDAVALAPCREGVWEPLLARYLVSTLPAVREAIAADERSLQKLFRRLGTAASQLPLDTSEERELFDWDTPEDLHR